ncbi:hypothetical protein B5E62_04740 [Lachnoclostridium sp. An118]|nr:hypothetical protein B5E62_04740 [Lachnoclostridium sp. An118]
MFFAGGRHDHTGATLPCAETGRTDFSCRYANTGSGQPPDGFCPVPGVPCSSFQRSCAAADSGDRKTPDRYGTGVRTACGKHDHQKIQRKIKKGQIPMKALHPLTEEQRIFAEEHHDFIYQYLNRRHLSIEEYYDTVVFGYLEAVQDYLEKPELKQYQFSTIARIAMRNALAREWEKQSRPMRKAFLEEYEDDTTSLDEFLPSRQERLAEAMDDRSRLLALLAYLTPKERQVVHLQANGYTYHEIAEICKISSHGVNSRFCRLRRKVRSLDGLEGSL